MLASYSYHIANGVGDLGAYEAETLPAEELKRRRKSMRKRRLPHLVADLDGIVAGYAYAVPFRKRPAYRYTVKHSIYVHHDHVHAGIGRILLPALIDACAAAGYRQMIGYIDAANQPSRRLHAACGFRQVGLLPAGRLKVGHRGGNVMVQAAPRPRGYAPPAPLADAWPHAGARERWAAEEFIFATGGVGGHGV